MVMGGIWRAQGVSEGKMTTRLGRDGNKFVHRRDSYGHGREMEGTRETLHISILIGVGTHCLFCRNQEVLSGICIDWYRYPYLQALEKHLAPRLRVTGGTQALEQFGEFINKQALEKGTDVLMMWRGSETLEVVVKPSGSVDLAQASSASLCAEIHDPSCHGEARWKYADNLISVSSIS
jgi:hypothetical protein